MKKSVVFYELETWSFTLREEHKMRVFENRVLRRIELYSNRSLQKTA
jgi:hypothetical protein